MVYSFNLSSVWPDDPALFWIVVFAPIKAGSGKSKSQATTPTVPSKFVPRKPSLSRGCCGSAHFRDVSARLTGLLPA
jgi:hypothetical protein